MTFKSVELPNNRGLEFGAQLADAGLMSSTIVSPEGEIALPLDLLQRHGLAGNSRVRIIETRTGILLIPLTEAPMAPELAQELAEWQSLAQSAWEGFPYEAEAE